MNNRLRNDILDSISGKSSYTINDIAQELGLSKTTISRAISGKGRIGSETRSRVNEWIEKHGYIPNPVAQALAVSRTFNAGIVLPKNASGGDAPFFHECLVNVTEELANYNYDVIMAVVSENDISGLKRIVQKRKVDGVILTRFLVSDPAVEFMQKENIPFVLIGSGAGEDIYQVDSDQKTACKELTDHLIEAGCKKIGLLAGNPVHMVNKLRYEGFCEAFSDIGNKVDENFVVWNAQRNIEDAVIKLISLHVDCIACMDDAICVACLIILREHGIRVPQNVRVVSFYDSLELQNFDPPITAVIVDNRVVSRQAGKLLERLITGEDCKHTVMVDYTISYRESSC